MNASRVKSFSLLCAVGGFGTAVFGCLLACSMAVRPNFMNIMMRQMRLTGLPAILFIVCGIFALVMTIGLALLSTQLKLLPLARIAGLLSSIFALLYSVHLLFSGLAFRRIFITMTLFKMNTKLFSLVQFYLPLIILTFFCLTVALLLLGIERAQSPAGHILGIIGAIAFCMIGFLCAVYIPVILTGAIRSVQIAYYWYGYTGISLLLMSSSLLFVSKLPEHPPSFACARPSA